MTGSASSADEGERERFMTVVHVRDRDEHAEVMFAESARIYQLLRRTPGYEEALEQLRSTAGSGRPLRVVFDKPNGAIIVRVGSDAGG